MNLHSHKLVEFAQNLPSRRRRIGIAIVTVAALASVISPTSATAAPKQTPAPTLAPTQASGGPYEARTEDAALRLAAQVRQRVEVLEGRSETGRVFATPSGTLLSEQYSLPQRVRRGDGWVPVDTTLRLEDGVVKPVASVGDVRFSAGGSTSMVTFVKDSVELSVGWSGALPQPALQGDTATYADVLPGVDLKLRATVEGGFSEVLVVKTRAAAANPELAKLNFPIATRGLTLTQNTDGVVAAVDGQGKTIFASDGAAMWDTPSRKRVNAGKAAKALVDDIGPNRTEEIGVDIGAGTLSVTPSQDMLTSPETVFPLTIDPTFNGNGEIWTHVSRANPGTSYWSGNNRDAIRVGQEWNGASSDDWRAFVQFKTDALNDAKIYKASFFITADHSADCAASPVELWHARGPMSTAKAVTWNNSSDDWLRRAPLQTVKVSANEGAACPKADDQIEFANANVVDLLQDTANVDADTVTFGLQAPDETNEYQWKKFKPGSAYLVVEYNHTPRLVTAHAVDSCYLQCGSPAVVRSGTPSLKVTPSDPNGGTLRVEFEVYDANNVLRADSGTAVTGVKSDSVAPWKVAPISRKPLPDGTYHWRAQGCDYKVCGGWGSTWMYFTVNTSPAGMPTVVGDPYLEQTSGEWRGGPGKPGSFTFGPGSDPDAGTVIEYIYSVQDANPVTVPAGAPQAQLLTPNQQQVSTDLTGFNAGFATLARNTTKGHASPQSLSVTPAATGATTGDTFASVGGDAGAMRLGVKAGKRYSISAWIYVPAATGLAPAGAIGASRGLRIAAFTKAGGATTQVTSAKATVTNAWQRLSMQLIVPTTATEAWVRLYNGFNSGSGKVVLWDDISVREVIGTTTVEQITPWKDNGNRLSVQSRTAGGFTSDPRIYDFLVTPSTNSWKWTLDETAGAIAASAPDTRPAQVVGAGYEWATEGRHGGALRLSGSTAAETSGPVLDTENPEGYTVAAWVRLTDPAAPGNPTAVSQVSPDGSAFQLQYRSDVNVGGDEAPDPAWCFTVRPKAAGAPPVSACTPQFGGGDWVSLIGSYDNINKKIKLYANGLPENDGLLAEASFDAPWSATGAFTIGRGASGGAASDFWVGDLDHVYASQWIWNDEEILQHSLR